jgi:hypothetical protein
MASKSKDVKIEQLRIFEKKLALRLQQLEQKGVAKEKAQIDPLVKSLKSKIRETNVRIAVVDKLVQKREALAKAKEQKLADAAAKKEEKPEVQQEEPKPKKKAAADKESKKQPAEGEEAAPKKAKKQADAAEGAEPKKKAAKKKEE